MPARALLALDARSNSTKLARMLSMKSAVGDELEVCTRALSNFWGFREQCGKVRTRIVDQVKKEQDLPIRQSISSAAP